MWVILLGACLIQRDAYEQRRSELADADRDGVPAERDCDDSDAATWPGAPEIPYDGVDQDCSGADLTDVDGDGWDARAAGGPDCDDEAEEVHPGATETWERGFTDADCDGATPVLVEEYGADVLRAQVADGAAGMRLAAGADGTVLIGAPYHPAAGTMGGAVWVREGFEPGILPEPPDLVAAGSNGYAGTAIAARADGGGQILVGEPGWEDGAGAAALVALPVRSGSTALDVASFAVLGAERQSFLGSAVLAQDLDGDGITEILVGAPMATSGAATAAGAVYAFAAASGAVTTGEADRVWSCSAADCVLGNALVDVGDQDGDGRRDLMVTGGGEIVGALLTAGTPSGAVEERARLLVRADGHHAPEFAVLGDIDGTGRDDVAFLGDRAWLFTDPGSAAATGLDEAYATLDLGGDPIASAAALGDRDEDGLDDFVVASTWRTGLGTGWLGFVPGSAVAFGAVIDGDALRLQAYTRRPESGAGADLLVLPGDASVLLVGAPSDDEGGTDAGAVQPLPVPG